MKLIILTAPSGAGKTSITRHLMQTFPGQLAFSISAATRAPRGTEKDGVEYYFLTEAAFREKIAEDAFVEWEMVYEGKYYGTLRSELQRIRDEGKVPVLDIDVKGAVHVQNQYPGQVLSLFIQPPSINELRRRLLARGTESEDSLHARLSKAEFELSFRGQFTHIIVNDQLDKACAEAERIIRAYLSAETNA